MATLIIDENGTLTLEESGSPQGSVTSGGTLEKLNNDAGIRIGKYQGGFFDIILDEVDQTQILPAAATPFTGDIDDLYNFVKDNFFFELGGGDGTSVECLEYTGTTSGAATFATPVIQPADGEQVAVEAYFIGRTTDNFQYFAKKTRSCSKSGAVVVFTTSSSIFTNNTIAAASQILAVAGSGLQPEVTGVAGKDFEWKIIVKKYKTTV